MLEWIFSSSVLITVVILLRFVLRGRISLRLQYALWALVLLRLLVPVSFGGTAISVENLARQASETEPARFISALSETELPRMSYQDAYNEVAEEYAEKGIQIEDIPYAEYVETVDYEVMNRMNGDLSIGEIAQVVWLSGIALVGIWFILSNLRLSVMLKKTRASLPCNFCDLPVYRSDGLDTPCLFGLLHPAICLTGEATEDENTLRHAVEHELTHYRHRDHIWAILRSVCLALHWYNPLVWWAAVLSRNDAELACDESTILRLGEEERAAYGRTLLRLTCEKRPALLNTATTMTGSGRSIKERIALIVKKPKMALYTVIAVMVIAAVAVGCTFTGAKEADTPWSWAQSLTAEDITSSVILWDGDGDNAALTDEESTDLVGILNALEKGDFTENTQLTGGTPTYGLTVQTSDGEYHINESIAPSGSLEMNYRDSQWWIDNDELTAFIKALLRDAAPQDKIAVEVDESIPQAVIDYARDYVQQQIDYYNELGKNPPEGMGEYAITAARITKLEQLSTGTAGLNDGVALYLLEYRLLPDHPENILMAGGMSVESGWLTESGSIGQPYLLLHYDDSGSETVWTPICVTNTAVIETDYGTPEMLEQYGNAYTAAAMELWRKHTSSSNDILDIQSVINSILVGSLSYDETWQSAGSYTITVSGADGRTDSYSYRPGAFSSLMSTPGYWVNEEYEWVLTEGWDDDFSNSDYILTAANDQYSVTVYSQEIKMRIEEAGGVTMYFVGTPRELSVSSHLQDYEGLFLHFRQYAMYALEASELYSCSVDGSEIDYEVIARELSEQYARILLDRPGWYHQRAEDAKVSAVNVFDAYYGEDQPNFCFRLGLALKMPEEQAHYWQAGAGLTDPPTSGEFAGYYGYGAEVSVGKAGDGHWRISGFASGGAWAHLPVAPEEATTEQLMELFFLTSGFSRDWRILSAMMEHPVEEIQTQLETLNVQQLQEFISGLRAFAENYPDSCTWSPDDLQTP